MSAEMILHMGGGGIAVKEEVTAGFTADRPVLTGIAGVMAHFWSNEDNHCILIFFIKKTLFLV